MTENDYFSATPFAMMADKESASHWAGRPKQLSRIEKILRRFSRRNESSLDVVWANFGAGKTHTLFYLEHRIVLEDARNICVVIEVPEQIRNFLDLYQRISCKLPIKRIANILLEVDQDGLSGDLSRAARALVHGGAEEKSVATQWICAEKVDARELRRLTGIGAKIDSDSAASDMFSSIITALGRADYRFCLMLDEFQRIEKLLPRIKSRITSSLRSLLSKNTRNFSLFFAIASRLEKTALAVVPDELQTIMGLERPLDLPEMNKEEALEFVKDRLSSYRPANYLGDDYAPLGLDAIIQGIESISRKSSAGLTPRTILQTMAYLYDEMTDFSKPMSSEVASGFLEDLYWEDADNG